VLAVQPNGREGGSGIAQRGRSVISAIALLCLNLSVLDTRV